MKKLFFPTAIALIATSAVLFAQSTATVPILDVQSGYLLGGSRSGKWINAKTTALSLKSGAKYRVFTANRAFGSGQATMPKSEGAPCEQTLFSKISPDFSKRNAEFALGGAHKPLPRAFRIEKTNQATYRQAVAALLKSRGIAKPVVQITQVWRVDLEGDGIQEVLLTATRKQDGGNKNSIAPDSRVGDYSLLLLRKLVRGRVQNLVLEGEFYPRAKKFNAPGFYQLGAVFDADGDGKMEILARGRYYEGEWTTLYSLQSGKPRQVLSEGCGA